MQNDDQHTSREDETFPPEGEVDAEHDEAAAAQEAPRTAEAGPEDLAAKTIAFPRGLNIGGPSSLDATFGMPDFDFPDPAASNARAEEEEAQEAESAMMAAKATLDLPIENGTGWNSIGSIERPESLRGIRRGNREDAAPTTTLAGFGETFTRAAPEIVSPAPTVAPVSAPPPPTMKSQATVMPFPGSGFSRATEPTPIDMLRGATSAASFDEHDAGPDEQAEPTPEFDAAAQDTLADAVQSALRNVYGGQLADRPEEVLDAREITVADTLMGGGAGRDRAASEPLWPESNASWQAEAQEEYQEAERERDPTEASTEAVLDYLYGQRRGEKREATVLSGDSSLRDFGEATGYSRDWQDGPEYDDREVAPPPIRDLGGMYRPNAQRYVEQGDRAFPREPEMAYRSGGAQRNEDADWSPPSYLSHPPAHIAGGQTYPTHLPSASPDSLSSGSPDSGHLLGAAGLGLIGGIALAGVLAVFVFNSFVDESDQTNPESASKVVGRLSAPAADNSAPVRINVPALKATPPSTPPVEAERAAAAPAQPDAPRVVARAEPPTPKLSARNAAGIAESPIKLDIKVADTSDKDESLISLKGLPPEAKLSTGIDVGGGQWLLPPARLKDLTVTLPKGTSGEFGLEVQLLKDDAQTSLSNSVSFSLKVNNKRQESALSTPTTSAAPATSDQAARLAVLPDETPQIETDFLTQMLIRDGNRLMRDGDIAAARRLYEQAAGKGNPEAALAMGRSYDPSYFEKLTVKTGKPDPATAFEWYKKALEGGLVTARVKIDALKQWLLR